jgi:hypothetical protein
MNKDSIISIRSFNPMVEISVNTSQLSGLISSRNEFLDLG